MTDLLSTQVRSRPNLWGAWRVVKKDGLQSKSRETRNAVRRFDERADTNLTRIARQLREGRFRFSKSVGVPVRRPGKRPRPIVVAAIENRVVQRLILDVLQRQPTLLEFLMTPTSFGGVRRRSVRHAIERVDREIKAGKRFYLRSDIADFFSRIPQDIPLAVLDRLLPDDPAFRDLLRAALKIELANLAELGPLADLFPLHGIGVAQGSCLSMLMGNILLREFDEQMNDRGVVCLRYVDDFLLLGASPRQVIKAFEGASRLLGRLGLEAYDPRTVQDKAEMGSVHRGFAFLGCQILPGLVRPSPKVQKQLLAKVSEILEGSAVRLAGARRSSFERRHSFVSTLQHLGNVLEGWREQFSFCNDGDTFHNLNVRISRMVRDYERRAGVVRASLDPFGNFRALGVSPLVDRRYRPFEPIEEFEAVG